MKWKFSAIALMSCVFTLAAMLIPLARAQSSQTQLPSTLRVNTRLIEVDVLVRDSHGQPVTGLTQKDFAVTDDGQGMPISFFSVLSPSTSASESQIAASSQQGPNVFTNASAAYPNVPPNLTIILVDALNTPFNDMIYSTQQFIRYLTQIKPADHVAVYTLGKKFGVLQDFSTNDAALVEAVKGYQASNASAPDAKSFLRQIRATATSGSPNEAAVVKIEKAFSNIDDAIPPNIRATSVSITLAALRQIALHVSGLAGRKNLLWLSGGFPLDSGITGTSLAALSGADLSGALGAAGIGSGTSPFETTQPAVYLEQLEETLRLVENVNIAIYPVDARGLVAETAAADPRFANTNTGGPEETSGASIQGMNAIADRTGGRAFFNTNAIATSLGKAQDDAQYSYLIGYYPKTSWDGKFHQVHIQVNQPGVHVRARQGYFAIAPPKSSEDDRKLAFATAAIASLDSTEIPFRVKVNPLTSSSGKASNYAVLISVNGRALQFTQDGDHWEAKLEFIVMQIDADGKPVGRSGNNLSWAIPAARYQDALDGMLTNAAKFTLGANAAEVRFIVRDPNSRQLGSITIPVGELSSPAPTK